MQANAHHSTARSWCGKMNLVLQTEEASFRTRGTVYMGISAYAQSRVEGGMKQVAATLPEGPLRKFSSQMFVAIGWYDALPIRPITEALAKLEGLSWEDSVIQGSMDVARRDLNIFRRVLFKAVSPERVVERLQAASLQYFDFGKTEIIESAEGRSAARFLGVPETLAEWFTRMMRGYASVLIEAAGGSEPQIRGQIEPITDPMIVAGSNTGPAKLVNVRVEMQWAR